MSDVTAARSRLQTCPVCRMSFVCPVDWALDAGGEQVRILLRCGQCEAWRRVTVSVGAAERLDRAYAAARVTMATAIADMERARQPLAAPGQPSRPPGRVERVTRRLRLRRSRVRGPEDEAGRPAVPAESRPA